MGYPEVAEKAVTLDPEFADAYNLLAFAYMRQGKQNEAMQP
jgi:Flp pilus assembly protein TadD